MTCPSCGAQMKYVPPDGDEKLGHYVCSKSGQAVGKCGEEKENARIPN